MRAFSFIAIGMKFWDISGIYGLFVAVTFCFARMVSPLFLAESVSMVLVGYSHLCVFLRK